MKIAGKTVDSLGNFQNVYECEFCGARSIYEERIKRCESLCYHKEEEIAGEL